MFSPRFRINWGDGDAPTAGEGEVEGGEAGTNGEAAGPGLVVCQDTDRYKPTNPTKIDMHCSMLEPLPSTSFNDVHSMDESSNVEMEMAF